MKATQYEKQGETVMVLHHSKFRRKGDNITWQREGVEALSFSGKLVILLDSLIHVSPLRYDFF